MSQRLKCSLFIMIIWAAIGCGAFGAWQNISNAEFKDQSFIYEQVNESNQFWESVFSGERMDTNAVWHNVYVDLEPWLLDPSFGRESSLIPDGIRDVQLFQNQTPDSFRVQYFENLSSNQSSLNSDFLLELERIQLGEEYVPDKVEEVTATEVPFTWKNLVLSGVVVGLVAGFSYWLGIGWITIADRIKNKKKLRSSKKLEEERALENERNLLTLEEERKRFFKELGMGLGLEEDYFLLKDLERIISQTDLSSSLKKSLLERLSLLEEDMLSPDEQYNLRADMFAGRISYLEVAHDERKEAFKLGADEVK